MQAGIDLPNWAPGAAVAVNRFDPGPGPTLPDREPRHTTTPRDVPNDLTRGQGKEVASYNGRTAVTPSHPHSQPWANTMATVRPVVTVRRVPEGSGHIDFEGPALPQQHPRSPNKQQQRFLSKEYSSRLRSSIRSLQTSRTIPSAAQTQAQTKKLDIGILDIGILDIGILDKLDEGVLASKPRIETKLLSEMLTVNTTTHQDFLVRATFR